MVRNAWLGREARLDRTDQLDRFLAGVEKRALRMAEFATQNREDALDLVQDAMFRLTRRYASRQPEDWPPLFFRTLQNGIRDWRRRQKVRNACRHWFGRSEESENENSLENLPAAPSTEPSSQLITGQAGDRLVDELQQLPYRQQQVFLLRAWEGLDVAQASRAMGCSEGSVKTHYSRAVHRLREALEGYWP